ncbi:ester cyclase [Streptomyces sp. NPDC051740]|uniref:ester cyclase n=1 Tax=Streptomyces sp. NPDC051740 TaxID=3365673 RepID=UPI0037B66B99
MTPPRGPDRPGGGRLSAAPGVLPLGRPRYDVTARVTVRGWRIEGLVAVRGALAGTLRGEFLGVPPNGKYDEITIHEFHEIDDGRVERSWHLEDLHGWMTRMNAWRRTPRARTRGACRSRPGVRRGAAREPFRWCGRRDPHRTGRPSPVQDPSAGTRLTHP